MGRYSSIDWIQFEWDEKRTGLGPVRSSLDSTASWYHQLGPWLDPGPAAGVSVCRLRVEGRVVVLARTRTGGADSRRTIRVQAYVGGSTSMPSAMPNVRQALALAPGWAARLPAEDEPLDLAELLQPYREASRALDREARAGAAALAPIVSECLRRPLTALSVASHGDPVVQLWGLVDILDLVLGHCPETFSTYESDDLRQGAEVIFLKQWPGPSSQGAYRARVDLRAPDQDDRYARIAGTIVDAYARGRLVELVKRLRVSDDTPVEERIGRLDAVAHDATTLVARPTRSEEARGDAASSEETWAPRPPARSRPAPPPPPPPIPAPQARAQKPPAQASKPQVVAPEEASPAAEEARAPQAQAAQAPQAQAARAQAAQARPGAARQATEKPAQARPDQTPDPQDGAVPVPDNRQEARSYAMRDVFEEFRADLAVATSDKEAMAILQDVRVWAATRQPSEVRSRLPVLIADLERLLPDGRINPILRDLLDPDASPRVARSNWLDPQWLVLVVAVLIVLVLQVVQLLRP
ncbi:hypothetical protein AB0I81_14105 [Nonomuraea sp. NPDC050404]|uniref:hypothetical protein n=1 Tax=Nonomuraea sp. NPDC050404 TaxID=3155783 RepID=UPI0033FCC52C